MHEVTDAEILAFNQGCNRESECWETCVKNAQAEIDAAKKVEEGKDDVQDVDVSAG